MRVLRLSLHGITVAYLTGYQSGRNVVTFDRTFIELPNRPTFTLATHPDFPRARQSLSHLWSTHQRLHPVLSNLLPEGTLRELRAQALKAHIDSEFPLFAHLGLDLPGALVAEGLASESIPNYALQQHARATPIVAPAQAVRPRFSLAGAQMKFSMRTREGRYHISPPGELGDWIVKMPSTRRQFVPQNEFSAMTLAQLAGVEIPEIKLVPMKNLSSLPSINLPDEQYAYAIRRFDRDGPARIHTEDFAQVFMQYPHEKYDRFHYGQIGKGLDEYTGRKPKTGMRRASSISRLGRPTQNCLGVRSNRNWTIR